MKRIARFLLNPLVQWAWNDEMSLQLWVLASDDEGIWLKMSVPPMSRCFSIPSDDAIALADAIRDEAISVIARTND